MSEPYVPKVGHLVTRKGSGDRIYIVTWAKDDCLSCRIICLTHLGGIEDVASVEGLTFLADRSAEWEALFQLDNTPTP